MVHFPAARDRSATITNATARESAGRADQPPPRLAAGPVEVARSLAVKVNYRSRFGGGAEPEYGELIAYNINVGAIVRGKNMATANPGAASGKVARQGEGKVLMVMGMPHVVKVESGQNAAGTSVMEVVVAPGQGVPPHTHTREDEIFYVVAGELTCQMDGLPSPVLLKSGDILSLPRNRKHGFKNASATEARILVTVTPGAGMDRMFVELDAACRKITDPQHLMPEVTQICGRCGVQLG